MPTIFFYGPELEKDKRRELIKAFTEKASELTGLDKSSFVVYLMETDADEVGVGGELLKDRLKRQYEEEKEDIKKEYEYKEFEE
ncbi:MAG: 4-oxalocrotonate tautomerase [Clostridia bacterium]|nr:4-oxalocrotonate tautomerase [Clostridia bacterium]